jgi:hypothetical protein
MIVPHGMISLTYHLTFNNAVTQRWRTGKYYNEILADFGITTEQARVIDQVNEFVRANEDEKAVDAWLSLVRPDLLSAKTRLW